MISKKGLPMASVIQFEKLNVVNTIYVHNYAKIFRMFTKTSHL